MRKTVAVTVVTSLLGLLALAQSKDITSLESQVERLRGLKFEKKVEVQLVDAARLRKVLQSEMAREYPESEWPKVEAALKIFGFIPPKMDLKQALTGLLEDQVAGLYDPRGKKLYVNAQPLEGADLLEGLDLEGFDLQDVFLVHELDHALTDQHFKLLSLPIEDSANEDRASAARCVVEGDATWVMLQYMYRALKVPPEQQGQMDDLMATMGLGRELMGASVPAYIEENLLMGYLGGLTLVKAAYGKGGLQAVNALYARPPASMEQVLHPEKYFAGKDPPLRVEVSVPKSWSTAGFSEESRGVWGEMNTRILLQEWGCDEGAATRGSEGWGGDAYVVLRGPSQARAFVWVTDWDSERDATEFAAASKRSKGVTVSQEGRRVVITRGGPPKEGAGEPGNRGAGDSKR
jgi:hypothetical protein